MHARDSIVAIFLSFLPEGELYPFIRFLSILASKLKVVKLSCTMFDPIGIYVYECL